MHPGIYVLRNPLFILFRPKLVIGSTKPKGPFLIRVFHKVYPMKKIRGGEGVAYFSMKVDIVEVILVVKWLDGQYISGFFDTPVGHFRFEGKRIRG